MLLFFLGFVIGGVSALFAVGLYCLLVALGLRLPF
jgi:hypothetical protein